jgi:hypothetical protein
MQSSLEHWFFKELTDSQRSRLIVMCLGEQVNREAKSLHMQRICLRLILKNLKD